jgi:membrane-associated phospholipid phosphatase
MGSGQSALEKLRRLAFAALLLAGISFTGCGVMSSGRGWGQDATLTPGWERLGRAAVNAAKSPATWAPAAGALALQIGDADHKISAWASKNTPIFGSQRNAQKWGDFLLESSGTVWALSALATPSGDSEMDWAVNKAKGFGVQLAAGIVTRETVGYLKTATDRTRPNGNDQVSFPSAHAAGSAVYATLAARNISALEWSPFATTASRIGLGAIAAATAWSRVEGNFHYPSDVLAGAAIGHFFGAFITDAFLGRDDSRRANILFEPNRHGAIAILQFNF